MASPHCNGWNRPAELQGGADRPSTEIAPRAGQIFGGRGPPREEREKDLNPYLTTAHNRSTVFCPVHLISLPQNTELHNIVKSQAGRPHLCFFEALILFTKLLQLSINGSQSNRAQNITRRALGEHRPSPRSFHTTFAHPNRRLELRYRPQDPFCHSLCGNRFPSSNLVLRVRRRVRKKDPKDAEIQMEILGVIGTTYKFQGMADFQCLAVHSEGGKDTSLYEKIILRKSENQEFFENPMPLFLPPASFSRLDCPVDYYFRPDVYQNSPQVPLNKNNFIGLNRARRPHNAIFVSFNEPTVPAECLEAAKLNWVRVCVKESDKQAEEQLRKMFESRPIWSRNAVKANINIHPDKLKLLLPVFAYYMVTGPWRSLWVRLAYDPRKSTDSKRYQILDFRIRCSTKHGYSLSDMPVKAKRSALNYSLPITFNKAGPQAASVMELPAQESPGTSRDPVPISYQLKESSYIFREGMLPPHRQMFYQLCDLDVESIKQVVEKMGDDEQACDERDGWCVLGTTDKLRDMISAMIKKVIRAQKPSLPEFPKRRRRRGLSKSPGRDAETEEEVQDNENKDDEDEDEDDEFLPSEGSENEMETEILDYI